MTRFLSWVQLRRRAHLDKMATNAEKVFHDGIEFSVTKLGNPNLELKKEQYDWGHLSVEKGCTGLCRQRRLANRSVANLKHIESEGK